MTIDQVVVKYIYQFGKLTLQGLGTFELTEAVPEAEYIQKHKPIPVSGIKFTHQPKAETDEAFVTFYGEQRGKIPSLSVSDIYTYLQMTRQLLNIGNPYEWKGLGTLTKQNDGSLVLEPGYYISFKDVEGAPVKLRERQERPTEKHSYINDEESGGIGGGARKILLALGIILLIAVGGWFGYQQFVAKPAEPAPIVNADTIPDPATTVPVDTLAVNTPVSTAPVIDSTAVVEWKGILREVTTREEGLKWANTYSKLQSRIFSETTDSINFRFFVVVNYARKDTARAADSLRKFFARPVKLEIRNPG